MTITVPSRLIHVVVAVFAGLTLLLELGQGHALAAGSRLVATVSLSAQRMEVTVDGRLTHAWKVSTARKGYVTPKGSFKPTRMPWSDLRPH